METKILFAIIMSVFIVTQSNAAIFFHDDMESGDFSSPDVTGSASWGGTQNSENDSVGVSSTQKHGGAYSIQFYYDGDVSTTDDGWAEKRINFDAVTDCWVKYYVYIPANYYHRSVIPSNNKMMVLFSESYEDLNFHIQLSLEDAGGGDSDLIIYNFHNGSENSPLLGQRDFIVAADRGTWVEFIVRVKASTNLTSADGIIQIWKNGVKVTDHTGLNLFGSGGKNYMDRVYLFGWSNSGFDENTSFYVDDITMSTTELTSGESTPSAITLTGSTTGTIR